MCHNFDVNQTLLLITLVASLKSLELAFIYFYWRKLLLPGLQITVPYELELVN